MENESGRASISPYAEYPVFRLLQRTAQRLPNKVAIIDGARRFTFQQLNEYSDRFAGALASLGVKKGDRVGIIAPNCSEFAIAFYGILKSGAVATTINTGYREREIGHQIEDSGAEVLVVHPAVLPTVQSVKQEIPVLKRLIVAEETSANPDSFWGLIESASATPPTVVFNPKEDLAALPYSSGTTGLPKGVMLSHFNLTANYEQWVNRPGEGAASREDDVILIHLPMFHIYGLQALMNTAVGLGATQVLMGRFDLDLMLQLLSQHKVTQLYTVPPVGLGLTNYPEVENYDLSALRMAAVAAAPASAELQQKVQEVLGCPVIQGFGMTELSPVANVDFMESERLRHGSVGIPTADTEERVVDLERGTSDVAPGDMGELLVRGPQVMKGYLNNPEATAETVTADGWLHTGDIVTMDREGYVWIRDRKKELIKYKGFQVAPAELEGVLQEHPAVMDAAVIGKADLESGEVPKAFIVSRPGVEVSAQALMDFVSGKVAAFKQVREVEFVDSIPKNPSGKILRRMLVEQERAQPQDQEGGRA